VFKEMFLTHM